VWHWQLRGCSLSRCCCMSQLSTGHVLHQSERSQPQPNLPRHYSLETAYTVPSTTLIDRALTLHQLLTCIDGGHHATCIHGDPAITDTYTTHNVLRPGVKEGNIRLWMITMTNNIRAVPIIQILFHRITHLLEYSHSNTNLNNVKSWQYSTAPALVMELWNTLYICTFSEFTVTLVRISEQPPNLCHCWQCCC